MVCLVEFTELLHELKYYCGLFTVGGEGIYLSYL